MPVWRALGGVTEIELEGIKGLYGKDQTAVWPDVRDPEAFQAGTLESAHNLPHGGATGGDELDKAGKDGRLPVEDHNTRIVVFGQDGVTARAVADLLTRKAFHNVAYFGGSVTDLQAALPSVFRGANTPPGAIILSRVVPVEGRKPPRPGPLQRAGDNMSMSMSIGIAESTGIWRFGRLAFTGMGCSLAVCYGKTVFIGVMVLFGAGETLDVNPHFQAVSMVLFAVFGLWGLGRDQRHIHDPRPFILGLTGVVILAMILYVIPFHKSIEFTAYTLMILSVFWNQNIALKRLAEQLQQRSQDVEAKNAQLAQASQMKSKFLAAMSHELRTPLNAIIGFSEVLDARMFGQLNEKQAEYVKDIHESGRHLLSLINDILDLSKIEAGRMELAPSRFDLPQLLESATLLIQERAAKHGLTLEVSIDERLDSIVADQLKIKQVLLNLLTNAVKFTPDGGRIQVKAVRDGDGVTLSVSDTGIGIAPADQQTIFDEFHQIITEDGRKREGTGLGLALTKRFVEMHHGTIGVRSQPGKGATFTVTLPLAP